MAVMWKDEKGNTCYGVNPADKPKKRRKSSPKQEKEPEEEKEAEEAETTEKE